MLIYHLIVILFYFIWLLLSNDYFIYIQEYFFSYFLAIQIASAPEISPRTFFIDVPTKRKYFLKAENEDLKNEWIHALTEVWEEYREEIERKRGQNNETDQVLENHEI